MLGWLRLPGLEVDDLGALPSWCRDWFPGASRHQNLVRASGRETSP
jgi:hypothetical protein